MNSQVTLRFLSLFVPNLAEAVGRYQALLGVAPSAGSGAAPAPHPFGVKGPVVFQLGDVAIALYECDGQTTHPGDVGLGIECPLDETASRLREQGGNIFWGPASLVESERRMAVGVLPDQHFFEIVEPKRPAR
jgi:hypothetical protein